MPMSVILRRAREPSPVCTARMSMPHGSHILRFIVTLAFAIVTAAPALIWSAGAQSFGTHYTSTAEKDCHLTNTSRDGSVCVCPGKAGLIVLVTEDDLR